MQDYIKQRAIKIGKYIVETNQTIRQTGKYFGVARSTVFRDVTERLPSINPELARQAQQVLEHNKSLRHIRGGEATKRKYQVTD